MSGSQQLLLGTGVSAVAANYIEDVFSTWLYTGTGAAQSITNGIDLSTNGGLVWTKSRSAAYSNALQDTVRGRNNILFSDSTVANQAYSTSINSFNTTGYTLGSETLTNQNGTTYVGWTFRKQPKFFDVVTWTGDGNTSKTISHSLGSVPGCIITKSSSTVNNWFTYHRSLGNTQGIALNLTNAAGTNSGYWNNTSPTSTNFTVGSFENASGQTYVAYLFAHDAGGFGLTGTDNVISCGSYTGNGASQEINLGYEPQWLLIKGAVGAAAANSGFIVDNMRGNPDVNDGSSGKFLYPNTSGVENSTTSVPFTATGFKLQDGAGVYNFSGTTYIYIAIRRGPMKTPTSGTSVFTPVAQTSTANQLVSTGFPVDLLLERSRGSSSDTWDFDRLRGSTSTSAPILSTSSTAAESTSSPYGFGFANNTGVTDNWGYGSSTIYWNFRRAPSFFDEVCYTGTGSATTFNHNLGVAPELMIVKRRDSLSAWTVWNTYIAGLNAANIMELNALDGVTPVSSAYNSTSPTSSVFTVGTAGRTNASGGTFVAYLFATCPGVSKVGSYTGTGAAQTINCGFTGGARFVLIKRTDSTGDWYVYDSARGISSGNDPYLLLNSTAAEVTGTNYVDTTSVGFQVTAAAPAGLNANGGTFVFLAIS